MNNDNTLYYNLRAKHYDEMYLRRPRQTELTGIANQLQKLVQGKKVLEVACGTGYWTERFAAQAEHVLATDHNPAMLAVAQAKLPFSNGGHTEFQLADAFELPAGDFNACVAGFWWSHIKRSEQSAFLDGVQKVCGSGALLVMFDSCYVEGESTPIARTDAEGNTYQIRRLADDSRHEIVKNFPTDSTLRKKLTAHARDIRVVRGPYFWMLTGVLR